MDGAPSKQQTVDGAFCWWGAKCRPEPKWVLASGPSNTLRDQIYVAACTTSADLGVVGKHKSPLAHWLNGQAATMRCELHLRSGSSLAPVVRKRWANELP